MRLPPINWSIVACLFAVVLGVAFFWLAVTDLILGDDADALVENLQREDALTVAVAEHTVEEIETARLVCAVAWSKLGHNVAISCVPKIPGLFDEPPR